MSAKPRGEPTRLLGTWDNEGTLLFSQGFKNFSSKTPCQVCHKILAMMHRYAIAPKGKTPVLDTEVFCSVDCYRKWDDKRSQTPLAPDTQG